MEKKTNSDIGGWVPPEENTNEGTTIIDIVTEYGDTGTAHGIPRIISSERWWAKIFWLLISCGLAVVFGIQGYGLLTDFFSWPYNTKIDVISKSRVEFPAVTVCNNNRMRRSELVGTRFQGIIDVDGGFDLDSEYSWFFDFSSDFYNDWYSDWDWESLSSVPPPGRRRRSGSSSSSSDTSSSDTNSSDTSSSDYNSSSDTSSSSSDTSSSSYGGSSYYSSSSSFYSSSWWLDSYYTPWWEASFYDNFDFDFDAYDSFSFQYDNYYNWDVDGESDWDGFYAQSKTDDYSDIADIANPTREELEVYGHQAEDFILQCTFDKRGCNTR